MNLTFKGKNAIVTGGGSGLGRECALVLAKNGINVLIADLKEDRCQKVAGEVEALGVKSIPYAVDVTKYDQVAAIYQKVDEEWGGVDYVVNSAGVCLTGEITSQPVKEIDAVTDINIKGTLYSCREALLRMRKQKSGKIVNMSSIAAKACGAGTSVYNASKSAVLAATASLGREAAKDNVNVNCVLPGIIMTSMWQEILDQMAGEDPAARDKVWAESNDVTPNGKPQEPIDIANAVAFLCSEEARYITAQNLGIDGGYTF